MSLLCLKVLSHFPLHRESNPSSLLWPTGGRAWPSPGQPHLMPQSASAKQMQGCNFSTSNKQSSFSDPGHHTFYSLCLENFSVHFPRLIFSHSLSDLPLRLNLGRSHESLFASHSVPFQHSAVFLIIRLLLYSCRSIFPTWASKVRNQVYLLNKTSKTLKQLLASRRFSKRCLPNKWIKGLELSSQWLPIHILIVSIIWSICLSLIFKRVLEHSSSFPPHPHPGFHWFQLIRGHDCKKTERSWGSFSKEDI